MYLREIPHTYIYTAQFYINICIKKKLEWKMYNLYFLQDKIVLMATD